MTSKYIAALAQILSTFPCAILEHRTISCSNCDMKPGIDALKELGYQLVYSTPNNTAHFFSNPYDTNNRIELIAQDSTPHEAWAVPTQEEFELLKGKIARNPVFENIGIPISTPELQADMFIHSESGQVVQIIWRDQPIYHGLFDAVMYPRF